MKIQKNKLSILYRYASRFSIVGIMNTVVDFGIFTISFEVLMFTESTSQVLGYSCGVLNSFIWNKNWTFSQRTRNKNTTKEGAIFILVNIISLLLSLFLMKLLVSNYHLNAYIAKVIVTLVIQLLNFFGYKCFVFN